MKLKNIHWTVWIVLSFLVILLTITSIFMATECGVINTPLAYGLKIIDINVSPKHYDHEVYEYIVTVKNTNNVVFKGNYVIYCKTSDNDSWKFNCYTKLDPGETNVHWVAYKPGPKLKFQAKLIEVNRSEFYMLQIKLEKI